jgi:phage gp29-like protein
MGFIDGFLSAFSKKNTDRPDIDRELATGQDAISAGLVGDEFRDNPDEVIANKGIEQYRKMRADEQVKAALFVKKFARLSTGWSIVPPDEPDGQELEATQMCQDNLQNIRFNKVLKGIMTGLDFGYSIGEKIYTIAEEGRWRGKIVIKDIKSKAPENFKFKLDEFDNILGIAPADAFDESATLYPTNKFVIYSYNQEFENPYGNSDLRGAYNAWWMKHLFEKFMTIYYERFGMPTAVGTYPEYAGDDVKETLEVALDSIQSKTSVSVPENVKIDLLEVAKEKGDSWLKAIEHLDSRMCRSILVPSLLGFSDQNFGSYALSKSQVRVFLWVLDELGSEIADSVINPQIIKPLCRYNFNIDRYPRFRFNNFTSENIHQLLALWNNMLGTGNVEQIEGDEDFIRDIIGLPNKSSGELVQRKEPAKEPEKKPADEPEEKPEEEKT